MEELARAHSMAGTPLPYGGMLIDDLRGARAALEYATAPARAGVDDAAGRLADAQVALEQELATFGEVLVALLGRDHADARTATSGR